MKLLHLVYIPFTGVGLHGGYRGDDWFRERIRVFEKFTLQSLKNQTDKDFVVWISVRPEEERNPVMQELLDVLDRSGLSYRVTYQGLMYWDDKFPTAFWGKLRTLLRHVRWAARRGRWSTVLPMCREVWHSKNATLKDRFKRSSTTLEHMVRYHDELSYETTLLTRIDSDDCFRSDAIGNIKKLAETHSAIRCDRGYIYAEETGELCAWEPRTNPPFHTVVFRRSAFWHRYMDFFGSRYKSHEDIAWMYPNAAFLPDGSYLVTVHGKNNHISTTWNHPFRGRVLEEREKRYVLRKGFPHLLDS